MSSLPTTTGSFTFFSCNSGFTTFQPSVSIETPITVNPWSLQFFSNSISQGISSVHPWHHLARNSPGPLSLCNWTVGYPRLRRPSARNPALFVHSSKRHVCGDLTDVHQLEMRDTASLRRSRGAPGGCAIASGTPRRPAPLPAQNLAPPARSHGRCARMGRETSPRNRTPALRPAFCPALRFPRSQIQQRCPRENCDNVSDSTCFSLCRGLEQDPAFPAAAQTKVARRAPVERHAETIDAARRQPVE
jgi:hypothetical protein